MTLKLRDYQEELADFIYEHNRSLILAAPGAGKTGGALTAMSDMLRDKIVTRWLVVAPKRVAVETWPVEKEKFTPHLVMAIAVGTPKQRLVALESNAQVVVINYENLTTIPPHIKFDGVIFDELTKMKNQSGRRFKAIEKYIRQNKIDIRVGLTGSFTGEGLEDCYAQCKIIDQTILGRSKGAFMQQYFFCINRDFGQYTALPGALEQVMVKVKPVAYVLENKEYLDGLPPLHVVEMRRDFENREPYEKLKADLVYEFPEGTITAATAGVVTSKLQQMASGFVYKTTKLPDPDRPGKFIMDKQPIWFSDHKFDMLDELIDELQQANTLIIYNFREELDELQRRYPDAETLDAPDAVARWNAGKIRRLLGHPASMQFGLNLQDGGHVVIFISTPWSTTNYNQAIARLWRQGQKHPVWAYILMTTKTIDERIFASHANKQLIAEIAIEELK